MARNSFYEVTLNNSETETVMSEAMCINGHLLVFYNGEDDLVVLYNAIEVKKVKKLHTSKGDNSESTEQDN